MWKGLHSFDISNKENIEIPFHLADADKINDFFITSTTPNQNTACDSPTVQPSTPKENPPRQMFSFTPVTQSTVRRHINSLKAKAVGVDDISLQMILPILDHCIDNIVNIINTSIDTSTFRDLWKTGIVVPLPKINNPTGFKDFLPICLLPVLSKVAEKEIAEQLCKFVDDTNLLPPNQSYFIKGMSTLYTLWNINDVILRGLDKK